MSRAASVRGWFWLCAGVCLVGALLPLGLGWGRLPEPIASHWGASGAPDGSMSKASAALLFAALVLLPAILAAPRRARATRALASRLALVTFSGGLTTIISASTVWLNWEVSEWRQAGHMSVTQVLGFVALPLALSGAVFAIARRRWPNASAPAKPVDSLPLESDERAYWSGGATNAGMIVLGVVLLMQGVVFHLMLEKQAAGWVLTAVGAVHVVLPAFVELFSKIHVTVDERAVTVRYGHLGWLRQCIRLDRIRASKALEIEAMEHGGWGYRGSVKLMGRATIMVRSGDALQLDLGAGKRLVISVDDAATASRLINGFIQRRGVTAGLAASPEGKPG